MRVLLDQPSQRYSRVIPEARGQETVTVALCAIRDRFGKYRAKFAKAAGLRVVGTLVRPNNDLAI